MEKFPNTLSRCEWMTIFQSDGNSSKITLHYIFVMAPVSQCATARSYERLSAVCDGKI